MGASVDGFIHALPFMQSFLSGNPATDVDDSFIMFLLLCCMVLLLIVLISGLIGILVSMPLESEIIALSIIGFMIISLSATSLYVTNTETTPGSPHFEKSLITPGSNYESFTLFQPFRNNFVYGADVVPINDEALHEIKENSDSDKFLFPAGKIIGLDKKHGLYRTYFQDENGGLWRIATQRFLWEQEVERPEKKTLDVSAINSTAAQADFQKLKNSNDTHHSD